MKGRFRIILPLLCALFCFAPGVFVQAATAPAAPATAPAAPAPATAPAAPATAPAAATPAAGDPGTFFSQVGSKLGEGANIVIGAILSIWTLFAGGLLILFTKGLLFVAQFNQFVGAEAVSLGWKIVRDICNMFFVLVLLIIAIGTILQVEKYHYSKLLPQFITMAIMINFSKTICGVLIDAAQVVMLTFVGAFSGAAGGNLFALLGMHQLWTVVGEKATAASKETTGALLGTFLLVAVFVTIADVVVFVMLMVLIARIVMLWFLIVLSPFAFILSILPGAAQKYAGQWWSEFTNYVIVGPAMAFFLWLSLAVVAKTGDKADITKYNVSDAVLKDKEGQQFSNKQTDFTTNSAGVDVGTTAIGTLSGMLSYVLGIGMLMGTLMVAQQLGVAGGKMAGAAVGGINDVLSGKRGLMPWRSMMGTAWSTFEGKQMDTWKKRGERLGNVGARLADSTIGKLAPTKAGRAEAQTRIEAHKEETTKRKMDNFAKAGDFAKLTPQELRNQLSKEKNGMRRAALVNEINKRGELGNEKGDTDLIATQAKYLEANGGAHMMVEFDDQIKKSNLTAAFDAGRFNDEHGNLSIDKFFAELKMGKFSSESVTDAMIGNLEKRNNTDADAAVAQKMAALTRQIAKAKSPEERSDLEGQKAKLQDHQTEQTRLLQEAKASKDAAAAKKAAIQEIKDRARADGNRDLTDEENAKVEALAQEAAAADFKGNNAEREARNQKAAEYEMAGHKMLGNRLVEGMKDAKQISSVVSNLSTNTWRSLEKNTSLLKGVTDEQRIAFSRAKGAYELAFDTDTDLDVDSEEGQKNRARMQELSGKKDRTTTEEQEFARLQEAQKHQDLFRGQILSKGDKRDEFYKIIDKQSAANKNIWRIVSENNDWKAASAQRVALYRDAEKKDSIKHAGAELIDEANAKGNEKGRGETIRSQRIRNLVHGVSRQNQYVSADGKVKDIYDARGESRADELLKQKGLTTEQLRGMSWTDKRGALDDTEKADVDEAAKNARDSYKIQISHDRLTADELEDQDWRSDSGASDESMEMFLDAYSSEQQRKIVQVNKELERKVLEFRHRDIDGDPNKPGYFAKKVQEFSQRRAAAEGDATAQKKVKDEYEDWKRGTLSMSNRMRKGDNTYTGMSTKTEDETKADLDALEIRHGLKDVAAPEPTDQPRERAEGGVVLNAPPRQQQGQRQQPRRTPQQPQQPPAPAPEDDEANYT